MKLNCKHCGAAISAEDIHLERLAAKCRACSAVFGFSLQPEEAPKPRPHVALPRKFSLRREGDELELSWRSRSLQPGGTIGGVLVSLIMWAAVVGIPFSNKRKYRLDNLGNGIIYALMVLVTLLLTYGTLLLLFNRTLIRVTAHAPRGGGPYRRGAAGPRALTIRYTPIPTANDSTLDASHIKQLYCRELRHSSKGREYATYELYAALAEGKDIKLIDDLTSADQALFLEQELETCLGIRDVPMPGELAR
jgi:hypothetical protein